MGSYSEHYVHALHLLAHEKEKRERRLEEKKRKLEKIKTRFRGKLDDFLHGKHAEISVLSREFLRQAVVVDEEKKKLDAIHAKLAAAKRSGFAGAPYKR